MAKVLRSIMGRRDKSATVPAVSADPEDSDPRLQNDGRNIDRRVSISRSGRYKQRDKRRSGIWDNPQLVHDQDHAHGHGHGHEAQETSGRSEASGASTAHEAPAAPAVAIVAPPAAPPECDKENSDAGSVRSKDSVRSRGSSVLLDTSQVTQELLDLAEQQLIYEQHARAPVTVTNL